MSDNGQSMFCPKCKAEYRAGFWSCSDCHVELIDHLPAEEPAAVRTNAELVVVRTFTNGFDATFAKNVLDGAGIESVIRGNEAGKLGPLIGFPVGIGLLVRSEDAAAADEILSGEAEDAE